MSRSVRKHPFCGITTSASDKAGKVAAHRSLRAAERAALAKGVDLPSLREVSDIWNFPKDGKQRFNVSRYPEGLRK